MLLQLLREHIETIHAHAERAYPNECCGLLIGYAKNDSKIVVEVWQAENDWSDRAAQELSADPGFTKERRYAIAPQFMLKAQKEARDRNLAIIGIYHSHPDNPPIPSACDREYAWPVYSYIIVSVIKGQASDMRCWCLEEDDFQEEKIFLKETEETQRKI